MGHKNFDELLGRLKELVVSSSEEIFPLEAALRQANSLRSDVSSLVAALGVPASKAELATNLLVALNSTSAGAAIAVKRVAARGDDAAGISSALVDLWGQSEAARALWFDAFVRFQADADAGREPALRETIRQLGPQAVAIATQLRSPVSQYVDFVSQVVA